MKVVGLEPTTPAPKADMLPLYHTVDSTGIEPVIFLYERKVISI